MQLRRSFAILATVLMFSASLYAATVTGTWNVTVDLGGQGGSPTFTLQQDGEKLTGTYSGALGEAPAHGTIKGADIAIDFEVQGSVIHYSGKLDDSGTKITGKCDYGSLGTGTFTATKSESGKQTK
jgi:hypothetical protein